MTRQDALDLHVGTSLLLALSHLPEKQRYAFVQHELHGVSYEEIGKAQSVTRMGAKVRVEAARKHLASELSAQQHDLLARVEETAA